MVTVEPSFRYLSVEAGRINPAALAATKVHSHARSMKRKQKMLTGVNASSDQSTFTTAL
jgi:hypothetical protein